MFCNSSSRSAVETLDNELETISIENRDYENRSTSEAAFIDTSTSSASCKANEPEVQVRANSKHSISNDDEDIKLWSHSMKSSSTYSSLASRPRQK